MHRGAWFTPQPACMEPQYSLVWGSKASEQVNEKKSKDTSGAGQAREHAGNGESSHRLPRHASCPDCCAMCCWDSPPQQPGWSAARPPAVHSPRAARLPACGPAQNKGNRDYYKLAGVQVHM
eukprot:1159431-Pelagomonas_calceolata.AAC.5